MNLSLNNSTQVNVSLEQFKEAMLVCDQWIRQTEVYLGTLGLTIPERALHIDYSVLPFDELPISLDNCDMVDIELPNGELLIITKYHNQEASDEDQELINTVLETNTGVIGDLINVVRFSSATAMTVRSSLAKARAAV